MDRWFLSATSFDQPGAVKQIAKPDFLVSSNWRRCAGDRFGGNLPGFYAVWSLSRYDRAHGIAFARGFTDQCSLALFKAPPPFVKVANADLSKYGTVRGLHIGSPYSQVLALYGPPVKRGQRFVTSYGATIPAVALSHQHVNLDERITIVVTGGLVSSIAIYIDLAPLT